MKLENLEIPSCVEMCSDVHCNDDNHQTAIDDYAANIFEALDSTAKNTLPSVGGGGNNGNKESKNIIGWSERVKPFKDDAMFWNSIWVSLGKPINCQIHNVMKHTRNVYHFEIRKCKRAEDSIKKNKLVNSCINGVGDIFEEVRKLRKAPESVANCIDGEQDEIPG